MKKVLCYLETLSPVEQLTLKLLSYKLVMLIALIQASHSQSISLLSTAEIIKGNKSFTLYYIGLLKQCRKGKNNPAAQFHMCSPDSDICVYRTLSEYIKHTSS